MLNFKKKSTNSWVNLIYVGWFFFFFFLFSNPIMTD